MRDCIVLGLGGMGAAALAHLSKRGASVLGLDRFTVPHPHGSSHGKSRIYRLAYHEHPLYLPILLRAHELWQELERETATPLLVRTGYLSAWQKSSGTIARMVETCERFGIEHEVLTAAEVEVRYPGMRLSPEYSALFQREAGYLDPEHAIACHLEVARRHGAEIAMNAQVIGIEETATGVLVRTQEQTIFARHLILCPGPWAAEFLPDHRAHLVAERQVLAWFRPHTPAFFAPENFPVFGVTTPAGRYYGFPLHGPQAIKVGLYHHRHQAIDPDRLSAMPPCEEDLLPLRAFVESILPDAAGEIVAAETCLFTNTPDEHALLGRISNHVTLAAGFSGHGYKLAPAIGLILADLALTGRSAFDLSLFDPGRFANSRCDFSS